MESRSLKESYRGRFRADALNFFRPPNNMECKGSFYQIISGAHTDLRSWLGFTIG